MPPEDRVGTVGDVQRARWAVVASTVVVVAVIAAAGCDDGGEPGTAAGERSTPPTTATTATTATTGATGSATTSPMLVPATPATTAQETPTTPAQAPPTTSPTTAFATSTTVPTAEGLAAELDVAEQGIRDPSLDAAARAAHGRAQQALYRSAGSDRALLAALPDLVAADVRDAVALNVAARVAVLEHAERRAAEGATVPPPPTLPAWTIVEPRPVDELLGYYREAEQLTGVPWSYLAAINFVETRMGRIVGASSAGALGPMQFLPATWTSCCTGDVMDPRDAIVGAATYLRMNGAPADMVGALRAYNPNDGYVGSVIAYATNMAADERAYVGYHAWEVFYATSVGVVHLPVGYSSTEPIDAATYLATTPG
jgi:Transglycosylase SLT domain